MLLAFSIAFREGKTETQYREIAASGFALLAMTDRVVYVWCDRDFSTTGLCSPVIISTASFSTENFHFHPFTNGEKPAIIFRL